MIQLFHPFVSNEAIEEVNKVLRSGWIGMGPKTEEFEKEFAKYVEAKHALAVNSATAALQLAVEVAGIKEGDEVITTPLTFVSTNHVILYKKAIPVFCDIDPDTLNIDTKQIPKLITNKTKAIIIVHYGGNSVDLDEVYPLAVVKNIQVIEDAAHACGSSYKGNKIGSKANLVCFSFHAVKNLPTGDGGMITTNSTHLYKKLRTLRWMGIDRSTFARSSNSNYKWEYDVTELGYKVHMNDINAAIGLAHLKELDKWNDRRREIVNLYKKNLPNIQFLIDTPDSISSRHLCVIKVPNRDKLHDKLASQGIETGVHYKPNTWYPMYKNYDKGNLINTEKAYKEILSLPLHLKLTNEDVIKICETLKANV